jgi:hypothetical protein
MLGHLPFGGARVAFFWPALKAGGEGLLWLAPVPALAFIGAIVTGAGFSLAFPSFGVETVEQVPPANRASALGAYVAFFDLALADP